MFKSLSDRSSKRSAIFLTRAWFQLCMGRILFAGQHILTVLRMSRPLFVGSYLQSRGGLSANEKEGKNALNDNKFNYDNYNYYYDYFYYYNYFTRDHTCGMTVLSPLHLLP